ncbi:MAG TPA: NifU family protein [Myxococcota bacterium]|nr:NifU family protein [Myxococcota bacterium]
MDLGFRMHAERTPNPNSIKWVLGQAILEEGLSAHFQSAPGPDVSPLAATLFAVPGVIGVFLAGSFITVTKRDEVEWTDIAQPLVDAIKGFFGSGEKALGPAFQAKASGPAGAVEERIRLILEQEIRPAVAMDGGDVIFAGYKDGVVELYLQGSCSGCPSSRATLKLGIEARLKEEIPEITEVVAV